MNRLTPYLPMLVMALAGCRGSYSPPAVGSRVGASLDHASVVTGNALDRAGHATGNALDRAGK